MIDRKLDTTERLLVELTISGYNTDTQQQYSKELNITVHTTCMCTRRMNANEVFSNYCVNAIHNPIYGNGSGNGVL